MACNKNMPPRKRFKTDPNKTGNITESNDSDDDSDNWSKNRKTKFSASNWDEIDLQKIGIYYEKSGYSDFNEVLDICPLVCALNRLPPIANEIITMLAECIDFDLKLENGIIEDADETMSSEEVIESLHLTQAKLAEQFGKQCKTSTNDGFLSIKYHSLRAAKKFVNNIIVHINHMLQKTQIPIAEGFFTMMISHFGSMCNLDPQYFSVYKRTVNVKGKLVTSVPDVRFTYTSASTDEPDGSNLTVSVVEVKKPCRKTGDGETSVALTRSSDASLSKDENIPKFRVHEFVRKDVLGQHGIELLVESFYSAKQNKQKKASHIFGMIMVGVQVVFTCLYVTDNEVRNINSCGNIDAPRRGIKYSKPFDILSQSDRKQAYKILFRLSEKVN